MPSIEEEVDRLFRLPLNEFVKARNELASTLKKSEDAQAASAVKSLVKPSASAWAVNQLYWRERETFDALVTAGDRYRTAQQAVLSGDASTLGIAERERAAAVDGAVRSISRLLSNHDVTSNPVLLRRITTTLEAIASYGSAELPAMGRLTEDLQSPGFGALSAIAPAVPFRRTTPPAPPTPSIPPSPTSESREEKESAPLKEERDEALRELENANEAFETASARAERAKREVEAARARLAELETEARATRLALEQARAAKNEKEKRLQELQRGVNSEES